MDHRRIAARTGRAPLIACASFVLACGADTDAADRPAATVRDSAGITIVENPAPAEDAAPSVVLGDDVRTAIGVLEGAPEYQLYEVRGAVRMSDGRIAVANSGSKELRFYGPDGEFLSASGRDGEGPGEFRELGQLYRLPGDSLVIYDWRTRRLSLMDPQGNFVRSTSVPMPDGGFPFPMGFLDAERVVMRLGRMFGGSDEVSSGVVQDTVRLTMMNWRADNTALPEPFVRLPGGQMYMAAGGTSENRWISVMTVLLAPSPETVVQDGTIYFSPTDRFEVRILDEAGTPQRIIRRAHTQVPVTQAMRDAAVERNLEGVDDENWKKRQRSMIEDMPVPEYLPAVGDLRVDAAGRIWAQRYRELPDEPATWDVFAPDGTWAASVQVPPRFRPLDIGSDYVLGVLTDEFDVEQVRLYDLQLDAPRELAAR